MENQGKEDWIWQLRICSTYGMNSHNLPRFSGIHWSKNRGSGLRLDMET